APPLPTAETPVVHPRRNVPVLVGFTVVTNLADGVLKVALPLLAVTLTPSPGQVAAVAVALSLPWLLASLHVGVLTDRVDRRLLLNLANAARMLVVAGLLAAVFTDSLSLPLLYTTAVLVGLSDVVVSTATSALVPNAVAPPRRMRANAWIAGAETVANEFAGPALGGLLIGLGAALSLGGTTVAYAVGLLLLTLLAGRFAPTPAPSDQARSVNADIGEGLRFLWRNRLLWTMTISVSVMITGWSAWLALLPTFATGELGLGATGYGLLLSAIGVGGLAGALLAEPINRLIGTRLTLLADIGGTIAMLALPALFDSPWLIGAAAFAGGMGGTLWSVTSRTITQDAVPDHMRGRFSATSRVIGWGTMPVGAGLAGVIAELWGPRPAFAVFALASAVLIIPFLRVVTPAALAEIRRQAG
ncbi:MAG: MFS transporter, partial [Stackebrandtia sp.]